MLRILRARLETIGFVLMSFAVSVAPARGGLTVFSSGMKIPETVSQAPDGFGSLGGEYLIPDSRANTIWLVPHDGGAPTVFATDPSPRIPGGIFLPSGWGDNSGKYLSVFEGTPSDGLRIYDSSGTSTDFATGGSQLTTPGIAPAGFGSFGGDALITGQTGLVYRLDTQGNLTPFAGPGDFSVRYFGITFAPAGWGVVGGDMLVSDAISGKIEAIDASGNITNFVNLTEVNPAFGLRQMAFAPAGFLPGFDESLLFVSVSGSGGGGGTLGDIVALDSSGSVVAHLRTDLGLTKFDPRGLLFRDDGQLLISDTSDPILIGDASDFQPIPEPSSLAMLGSGLMSVAACWARRRSRSRLVRLPEVTRCP
jgi:hypothetical protein